jgi:hypothetical protein
MANLDIADPLGLVDKRVGRGRTAGHGQAEVNNMTSISAMRTRLAALNGAYYTAARLDTMTENDMVYALKDTASI